MQFCSLPELPACNAREQSGVQPAQPRATVFRATLIYPHYRSAWTHTPAFSFRARRSLQPKKWCSHHRNTKTCHLPSFPEMSYLVNILLLGLVRGEKSHPQELPSETGQQEHWRCFQISLRQLPVIQTASEKKPKPDTISSIFYKQKHQLSVTYSLKLEVHLF